ncbi:MAG TPA: hypothetical protein EYM71_06950 [Rhodospirillales bacterium]|nr:hypothetical protein [Rhodospirillales bacterium]
MALAKAMMLKCSRMVWLLADYAPAAPGEIVTAAAKTAAKTAAGHHFRTPRFIAITPDPFVSPLRTS